MDQVGGGRPLPPAHPSPKMGRMSDAEARKRSHTSRRKYRTGNDKCGRAPLFGRSEFPRDAVARIYKPCRSVMTSGRAQPKGWRLVFERRTAPVIEPLMGYTGGADTLTQVELDFPTAQAAIDYAERRGLAYAVQGSPAAEKSSVESSDADKRLQAGVRRGFAGATLWTGADGRGGVLCIADGRGRRSSSDSRRETRVSPVLTNEPRTGPLRPAIPN
ncbi:NADH dehydrogenase ubiquinone Fe-S protein 4 [Mesorhizobium sp. M0185]|uniref:NADH dehydrogenase ubiquinone Fe-S protein 4 n=1 Tax=Mesorhizobium sp. M0185 TaxID=2956907 RepID=UPI003338F638